MFADSLGTTAPTNNILSDVLGHYPLTFLVAMVALLIICIALTTLANKKLFNRKFEKKNQELEEAQNALQQLNHTLEQKIAERTQKLEQSLSYIQATLSSTTDGILVVDITGKRVGYNQKFARIWNIPDYILEDPADEAALQYVLAQVDDAEKFMAKVQEYYINPEQEGTDEILLKDNRIIERYSQPQWSDGKIVGRVWSFRDITQHKKLEEQVSFHATHDSLTQLPNRTLLLDRLHTAILSSELTLSSIAILTVDIDRFKLINDSFGHNTGDKLLQQVAARLKDCIKSSDTLARLGTDEFIILLPNITHENHVISTIQRIQRYLAKPFNLNNRDFTISTCIGISLYPKDGKNTIELLKKSDTAMERAKETGGNSFQFYTEEMNARTLLRMELEHELRMGLEENEFALHYQPLIDLKSARVIGVEALIRWNNPQRGLIMPEDFISLAEETGLIIPMSDWVLRSACKQLKKWQNTDKFPHLKMAVNISAKQFLQTNFAEKTAQLLDEINLTPHCLEFELTESILMGNSEHVTTTMRNLRELGIDLVLDDFGTGYSSLSYLTRFPISKIKIDRSFVQGLPYTSEAAGITSAIIAMAKNLKLTVLAEGVESTEQLTFLKTHATDEAQGFLFSPPLEVEPCEQFITELDNTHKIRDLLETTTVSS